MLHSLYMAAGGTLFIFLMTTLGSATVFFFSDEIEPKFQNAIIGFAAGVMTAASVWSLLLPAIEQAEQVLALPSWVAPAGGFLLGVIFLAALDAALPRLRKNRGMSADWQQTAVLMAAITLHNVPEGMAVGLAFALAAGEESVAAACALALGIGIQNFPEGAAISLPLRQEGRSRFRSFLGGMLSGVVEPVFGILVVLAAAGVVKLMPWLLSFAAGAMIYVVVEELVPQAHNSGGTCGYIVGFLVMMILDVALG